MEVQYFIQVINNYLILDLIRGVVAKWWFLKFY